MADTDTEPVATEPTTPTESDSWLSSLPEDMRGDPSLVTVPDVPTLAKNYLEQSKVIGRKGVIVPNDNDPPEKLEEFYKAIGRPEAPDKYEFARPEMPEGLTYSEDFEKSYRETAHKLGISQKAAKGLFDWFVPLTMEHAEAQRSQVVAATEELKNQWGDKYEANMSMVQKFAKDHLDAKDFEALETTGLGNHPGMVRMMFNLSKLTREDGFVSGKSGDELSLQQQIDVIERNPALIDPVHPEQKALQKKRDELYRKLYPSTG